MTEKERIAEATAINDNLTSAQVREILMLRQLKRIADALEELASCTDTMSNGTTKVINIYDESK